MIYVCTLPHLFYLNLFSNLNYITDCFIYSAIVYFLYELMLLLVHKKFQESHYPRKCLVTLHTYLFLHYSVMVSVTFSNSQIHVGVFENTVMPE